MRTIHARTAFRWFLAAAVLGGCATDSNANKESTSILPNAVHKPLVIYVTDFYLDPKDITDERLLPQNGIIGSRLTALRDGDPAAKAQQMIHALSQSIVETLNKAGQSTEYRPNRDGLRSEFIPADASFPNEGWVVGGWFTRVDEGNRVAQATIGFGVGKEEVETQVVVSDLATGLNVPFLQIGTASAKSAMPGGMVVGKNPYVMAAKFVLSRGATERDVQKQGQEIAHELIQYINTGGKPATP